MEKEQLAAVQLRELDQTKTRFFSNISHEFRTPLTVILGMTDEITGTATAKQLIQQSGQNLLRLVNQLLDFSKIDSGKLELKPQLGDLVPYLQYLLENFQSMATHKNVQLSFEPGMEKVKMGFDKEKMQHIISNLLSNAIKFTPRDGKVKLEIGELEIGESQILISVSDTGIGIPADQLPRIFERYFQVNDPMSQGEPGSGIGLAFTKELVELMRGRIEVKSEAGKGSVFTVILPYHPVVEVTSLREDLAGEQEGVISFNPTREMTPSPTPSSPLRKDVTSLSNELPSLLLIEDTPEVVTYIKTILQNKYEITVAENGQIGIEKAVELIPDIIISDIMMPIKDGFAVTRFLKNDERTSHIPIILLTAKADAGSRLAGLERGADAYLAKPFDKKELKVRLEQLVELRKKLQARYAHFTPPQPTADVGLQIEDAFLQKINGTIEANLGEAEFNVNELCSEMLMSRSQLFRKLKALTGRSIVAYLRSARLHKAKELLLTGRYNVSEVAYQVGFNDPKYFSRTFSQEFGHPPTELG